MDLVERLATRVSQLSSTGPRTLIAIDGPDAAGKTSLADRLARVVPLPAVRASLDGFHRPRAVRYARGELSAEGYYRDSFDYQALVDDCLAPFAAGANRVRTSAYDHRGDTAHRTDTAPPHRAVLIVDGVFLLRPELRAWWTLAVYLRVSPGESLRRALCRAEADPEAAADVVVDHEHAAAPVIVRWAAMA